MNNQSIISLIAMLLAILTISANPTHGHESTSGQFNPKPQATTESDKSLIQIAILLDTSGSMRGLVDQARIQIWNVVDELSTSSRNSNQSELEIAVYQYGTETVSKSDGYIRRVLDFSGDLDEVSRALFSLEVKGGVELCGEVVRQSCDDLNWSEDAGYKAVFIAGNEAFDQGQTSFASVIPRLREQQIKVNTIYCRWKDAKKREDALWQYAAQLASGTYAMINHNRKMEDLSTPYDDQFRSLNRRMNDSFVWYGKNANKHMKNQIEQDKNADKMSNAAFASRMSSKIGHLYKHVHSDLVDALQHNQLKMDSMPEKLMPENIRAMKPAERMSFLKQKISEREQVRREMATLISQRDAWIRANAPASQSTGDTWGDALRSAVRTQLKSAGFEIRDAS